MKQLLPEVFPHRPQKELYVVVLWADPYKMWGTLAKANFPAKLTRTCIPSSAVTSRFVSI